MGNQNIWFPRKSAHGYFDKGMQKYFNSKSEKREYMNSHNLVEDGSMESEKHRENRLVDQINYEREKKGMKPRNREQIVGDSKATSRTW